MFDKLSQRWIRSRKGSAEEASPPTPGNTTARGFTTASNLAGVGSVAWSLPSYALTSNDFGAQAFLSNQQSNYLFCETPLFVSDDVPANATILGFEVNIRRNAPAGTINDTVIRLHDGSVVGDNKTSPTPWSSSYGTVTYGGPSDLWGLTKTRAEWMAMGVVISATASGGFGVADIDYVSAVIYYEA